MTRDGQGEAWEDIAACAVRLDAMTMSPYVAPMRYLWGLVLFALGCVTAAKTDVGAQIGTVNPTILAAAVGAGIAFLGVPVLVMGLGVIVVVVQTLVFCLLSTVYITMAIAHEEH